jgi:hypothetical protein
MCVSPLLLKEFSNEQLVLFVLGGLFYVVGIAFFILGEIKPIYHVVSELSNTLAL